MGEIRTPEELAKIAKEKEEKRVRVEKKREAFRLAINAAQEDANVRIILRGLCELCGFRSSPVVLNTVQDVAVNSTIYNGGREAVFHDLRKLMSAETENIVLKREE
jgi:hypothetical protein